MSISTSCSSLMTTHQPTTTSILLEENIRRTIAAGEKPSVVSRSPVRLRTASSLQSQSTIVKSERQSNVSDTADATETSSEPSVQSVRRRPCMTSYLHALRLDEHCAAVFESETTAISSEEPRHRPRHPCNTGNVPLQESIPERVRPGYSAASAFSIHKQSQRLESERLLSRCESPTGTRDQRQGGVREMSQTSQVRWWTRLALGNVRVGGLISRLQASTIKGEQRRRPNELGISRPIKSAAFDRASTSLRNSSVSPKPPNDKDTQDGSESKLEIRCADCKSTACTGSQECPSSKRLSPSSLSPNMRDTTPARLTSRLARAALPARPRTSHPATREARWRSEQTRMNPVILTPSFETELSNKRAQTPFANGFLPGKLIRSQRRETLTTVPPQRASS